MPNCLYAVYSENNLVESTKCLLVQSWIIVIIKIRKYLADLSKTFS